MARAPARTATTRRHFLESVGGGMLVAGLGATLSHDLGVRTAFADEGDDSLAFGKYDALVDLLQSTPPDKLQPILIEKLNRGETDLKQLTAAGALANAETFGGEDYVGFHTAMAMLPALADDRPAADRAPAAADPEGALSQLAADSAIRRRLEEDAARAARGRGSDRRERRAVESPFATPAAWPMSSKAEKLFATLANAPLDDAFNVLQPVMQDDINVHRFVFAHRTHGLAELLGKDYAYTILRQCVRFCCSHEQGRGSTRSTPSRRSAP